MTDTIAGEAKVTAQAGRYLTFQLGGETYGLGILNVQEIIGLMPITHVPRTPGFIRGVINLRGRVIPVIELRLKFGMESIADTERTCIIVAQVSYGQGQVTMGLLVDEVSEVLDIQSEQIEAPPTFGGTVDTAFLMGMGKVGDRVVMLLDVNHALSTNDLSIVGEMAAAK